MNDEKKPRVKSIIELWKDVDTGVIAVDDAMEAYLSSRLPDATDEERFNEGKYGRATLAAIDATQAALTQLRMRVALQLDGRENARAAQLDRILGIAEEPDGTWVDRGPAGGVTT